MRISFIIPTRNNFKYVQACVKRIIELYQDNHDIIILDDASTDETWKWAVQMLQDHSNIMVYRHEGPDRVGHTVLYDIGIKMCKTPIFSILHADMIIAENYVENLVKRLKPRKVVCATRIEPPLHPPGPEKWTMNFGLEPHEFKSVEFNDFVKQKSEDKETKGIFAPWCMYKDDFVEIGGHDALFAPMELEDSDLFNRMHLAGYELTQSWDSLVYHMTCRGSRFKDGLEIEQIIDLADGTKWHKPKDSEEYTKLRQIKFREWWRKWKQNVLHDEHMLPIVHPVYNIHLIISHCNIEILTLCEPWFDCIYLKEDRQDLIDYYITTEQSHTLYDLKQRVKLFDSSTFSMENIDTLVEFDARKMTVQMFGAIQQLSQIINNTGELGVYTLYDMNISITNKHDLSPSLIKSTNNIFK